MLASLRPFMRTGYTAGVVPAVPVFRARTYLVYGCNPSVRSRRMADAEQHAVSQLFREHNRVLVGYLTARLRSERLRPCIAAGSLHWSKYMPLKWSIKAPMEYSFDRVPPMAPGSKSGIERIVLA